jgi:hypothetical protein
MRRTTIPPPIIRVQIRFQPPSSSTTQPATQPATQLTAAEIVRELKRLCHDPANGRGKGRKVPLKWIAEQAGVNRARLYRIMSDGRVSDSSREALSPVLIMLQRPV